MANEGCGMALGLEEDEEIFFYRFGTRNVGIMTNKETAKKIMEVLNEYQGQTTL